MAGDSTFRRAARIDGVRLSGIVRLTEAARRRRAEGFEVISLSIGEPDFDTPEHAVRAAEAAMARGDTHYPPTTGTAAMKAAIRQKFARENGVDYAEDEVMASNGAKQVLFNALMATLDPGDEVIVPAPYWASYVDMVRSAGGTARVTPTSAETGYKLTPAQLRAAITPRSRWLILNSPGNPTGAAYSADEFRALAAVLAEAPQVWVMSDEIYEHLTYDGFEAVSFAAAAPGLRARTLLANGVAKAYAMTGWRLGYAAGPAPLISAMALIQSQSTSGVCTIAQAAAIAALEGPQDCVAQARAAFAERRAAALEAIARTPRISCRPPEGAFYAFMECGEVLGCRAPGGDVIADDEALCAYLLTEGGVALAPGSAFGAPGRLRLSYAAARPVLETACARMADALGELS